MSNDHEPDLHPRENLALPFRWEDVPREPIGPRGYRSRAEQAQWRLELNSGRAIRLASIRQSGTNDGVLCGSPRSDSAFNARHVKQAIEIAAEEFGCEPGKVAVLPPCLLRSIEKKRPGDPGPEEIAVDYLPPVQTFAVFESSPQDGADADADGSSLVVVWFQNAFGQPEEGHVMEQLRALDWESLATDWSW